jgi:hypothetical protein
MTYGMAESRLGREAPVLASVMQVPPATMKPYFSVLLGLDVSTALVQLQAPDSLRVSTSRQWRGQPWFLLAKDRGCARSRRRHAATGDSWLQVLKVKPDTLAI